MITNFSALHITSNEVSQMDQSRIPILEMLQQYQQEQLIPFHMPGHKGGKGFAPIWQDFHLKWDITEIDGSDNLHDPQGVIQEAQELAAQAFGAQQTFFLINGASIGIMAMLLSAVLPGQRVIIPRNCHKSVMSAVTLGRMVPVCVQPQLDEDHLLMTGVSAGSIEEALERYPDTAAVLVTYPNYYGMGGDIEAIARIVHRKGKILLVDEAHGAHFPFSDQLPPSSGELGADLWVQSAHKTLPAFTQTAYLHMKGDRVSADRLRMILRHLHTTSPSYLLMMSLDWARHFMATRGGAELERIIEAADGLRHRINREGQLYAFGSEWLGRPGVHVMDPTRLVVDVRKTGFTGYEMERILRREYRIQVEMADWYHLVCIITAADDEENLQKLEQAFLDLPRSHSRAKATEIKVPFFSVESKEGIPPGEVALRRVEEVNLTDAGGRISAGTVGVYPPGIPLFYPGEIITEEGICYLREVHQAGGRIFGWRDALRQTIGVVQE
jgi:lysine decarboxylase